MAQKHPEPPLQVCRVLLELGHSVTVITGAPAGIFLRELRSACLAVRKAALDFGAKQKDAFSVDMAGACPPQRCSPAECLTGAELVWCPTGALQVALFLERKCRAQFSSTQSSGRSYCACISHVHCF